MVQTLKRVPNRPDIQIFSILLLAFALRVIALDAREIWYDDAFSILLARHDIGAVIAGAAADDQPPLYYAFLHYFIRIGDSPFIARFLSVMLSMLIVAMLYATARARFNSRAARNAALFAAMAPFQIYHAQEARMYALLALALLWYLNAVHRLESKRGRLEIGDWRWKFGQWTLDAGRWRPITSLALSGALALYTHNLAILTLAAANVYFIARREGRALKTLVVAQLVSLILFLPWAFHLPAQLAKIGGGFWILPPSPVTVLQTLMEFTTNLPLPAGLVPIALFVSLALVALAMFETARALKRGAPRGIGLLIAFALVPPLLMLALSFLFRPIFITRGIILSSLAYYILLGWLASRVRPRIQASLMLALAALILVALNYQYTFVEFPRSPYRAADAFLRANTRAGDVIVHDNKLSFFPMHYYDATLAQTFIADPPRATSNTLTRGAQDALKIYPTSLDDAARGNARVWFVIYRRALDEAHGEGRASENKAWLDANYQFVALTKFNDLNVYLYQK